MSAPADLVCTGRPVRRFDNSPRGERCAARYLLSETITVESARVAGWCVGPPAEDGTRPVMCPSCRRPGDVDEPEPGVMVPLPGL